MWLLKHHVQPTCPTTPMDGCTLFVEIVVLKLRHVLKCVVILNWEPRTARQLVTKHGDVLEVLMCISTVQQLEMVPPQHWDWSSTIFSIMIVEEDVDQITAVVYHTNKCMAILTDYMHTHSSVLHTDMYIYTVFYAFNLKMKIMSWWTTCMLQQKSLQLSL